MASSHGPDLPQQDPPTPQATARAATRGARPLPRSKTVAAWLALLFGTVGAHRLYLYGARDRLAWLYPIPSLAGLYGFMRMRALGVDDTLGWMLVPLLGLMVSIAMLSAIVYALTPDAKWQQRHSADRESSAGVGAVLAAILALLLGGAALMATIAFSAQKFFEWQMAPQQAAPSRDFKTGA